MSSAPIVPWRRLTAEFLGSSFLAAVVIGAGIVVQRLSPGQIGLELLEDAAPTRPPGRPLVAMLDWLTHDGQAYAAANLYVPCRPRSGNSPSPCFSRSPAPAAHTY